METCWNQSLKNGGGSEVMNMLFTLRWLLHLLQGVIDPKMWAQLERYKENGIYLLVYHKGIHIKASSEFPLD